MNDTNEAPYLWGSDPYWVNALDRYTELSSSGENIQIDLKKIEETISRGDGPAYKLMDAMIAIQESEGFMGFRGAPRVVLALLALLHDASIEPTSS